MKTPLKPIHFPANFPDGPWGVNGTGEYWYVIHRHTGRAKRIGRIYGFKPVSAMRPNYFKRAMAEAEHRNHKEHERTTA